MIIEYMKVPLHKYTFKPRPMREWVECVCEGKTLNLFAGPTRLEINETTNDIDDTFKCDYNKDAIELIELLRDNDKKFNTIILDPPYSYRKSMEMYKGNVNSKFNLLKDLILTILDKNGIVITFGYHSISMGSSREFDVEKILLMYHGGAIHDTIATVERLREGSIDD